METVLLSALILIVVWINFTKRKTSEELCLQVNKLIDDIIQQTDLLKININILHGNVLMLNDEVEHLKVRNELLNAQIKDVRDAIQNMVAK